MIDALKYRAILFAEIVHGEQKRKYTDAPYLTHLAEVAGMVTAIWDSPNAVAVAWLHDCIEDCGVKYDDLVSNFNKDVADGVLMLSDLETGNRATRKELSRKRLADAPDWVQDIKLCDIISNTPSIVQFDHRFAPIYLEETSLLLQGLTKGNLDLMRMAKKYIN